MIAPFSFLIVVLCLLSTSCERKPTPEIPESKAETTLSPDRAENPFAIPAQSEPDTLGESVMAQAIGQVGDSQIEIEYHSPAVRGRAIWGREVPYGQLWVTGSHSATRLTIGAPLLFGGKELPAGKYAIFTIPGRKDWEVIINRDWNQHLTTQYARSKDVLRFTVKPSLQMINQERLRYEVISLGADSGQVTMSWEKVKISIPLSKRATL
ncbi:hypothetical protein GCM10023183_37720 [Nibribacter koreensis]|uniref:DUF2911 domain-containing protein n=2 Tax=Nibribacter koreensis TaxID=1084519 RepID=A0ABP8G3A5_9BACT